MSTKKTLEINYARFAAMHDALSRVYAASQKEQQALGRVLDTFNEYDEVFQAMNKADQPEELDLEPIAIPETVISAHQPSLRETQLEAAALTNPPANEEWQPADDDWSDKALAYRFGANGFGA